MDPIVGNASQLGATALKALLLFLTAVAAFRVAQRRTTAELAPFDFVAAVACGAIVGRVPNSTTTSYVQGAVTLLTILAAHAVLSRLRFARGVDRLIDHPPALLVVDGVIDERQARKSGLTNNDFLALLRSQNVHALGDVRYVIFEQRGSISVVRKHGGPQTNVDEAFDAVGDLPRPR